MQTTVSGKWFKCPAGTTAASVPANQASNTFCARIAAGYYGTVGVVSGTGAKHAVVTACPYGGTSSASPSTSTAVTTCTP